MKFYLILRKDKPMISLGQQLLNRVQGRDPSAVIRLLGCLYKGVKDGLNNHMQREETRGGLISEDFQTLLKYLNRFLAERHLSAGSKDVLFTPYRSPLWRLLMA